MLRYPNGIHDDADLQTAFGRFEGLHPLPGSLNLPTRVIDDCKFRLIQLHEMLHAYAHPFRSQIREVVKSYLRERVVATKIHSGPPYRTDPILGELMMGHTFTGAVIGMPSPPFLLAETVILSQVDELFVDFFGTAAAGVAYWTTALDFEGSAAKDWGASTWSEHHLGVYEAHPVPLVRFGYFPEIILRVLSATLTTPSVAHLKNTVAAMQSEITHHLSPKSQTVADAAEITYKNEAVSGPNRIVKIPVSLLLPFYEFAFEAFTAILLQWFNESHPLSVWALFLTTIHHDKVTNLAQSFLTQIPSVDETYPYEAVAGAAGARLCYDLYPSCNLQDLQTRAKSFLDACSHQIIPIRTSA